MTKGNIWKTLISVIIGAIGIVCAIICARRNVTPMYTETIINDTTYIDSPIILPGETITQEFHLPQNNLTAFKIALAYDDFAGENGKVKVELYQGDRNIVNQELLVSAWTQRTFMSLAASIESDDNLDLKLKVTNISENPDVGFSLLTTNVGYQYQEYTDGYEIENQPQTGSLIVSFQSVEEYDYYKGMTYGFWILIGTIIVIAFVNREWMRKQ